MARIIKSPIQVGQRWGHLKRGSTYEILSIATGQGGTIEDEDVVVYVRVDGSQMHTGQVWCRCQDEFLDGRFELVQDVPKHVPQERVSADTEQGTKVSFEFGGLNANGDVLPRGVMHVDIPSGLQKALGCAGPVSMGSSQKDPLAEAIQEAREKCKAVDVELKATENLYRNFIPSRDRKAAIVIQRLLAEVELLKAGEPGVDYPVSGVTNLCQEVEIGPMSPKDLE